MNIGDMTINIEHGAQTSQKKASTKDTTSTKKASAAPDKSERARPTKSKSDASAMKGKPKPKDDAGSSTPKTAKTPKAKAGDSSASKKATASASLGPGAKVSSKPTPKSKTTTKDGEEKGTAKKATKSEPKAKKEPSVKKKSSVKKEPTLKPISALKSEPSIRDEPSFGNLLPMEGSGPTQYSVTGVYDLWCPQLEVQSPEYANKLRMSLCVDNDNNTIWGSFGLVFKSGVIKVDGAMPEESLPFGWRARDSADGGLKFGRRCYGNIVIEIGNQVHGEFYNMLNKPIHFQGKRRPGPLWCGRAAHSFEQEWKGYVDEAYGR